MTTTLRQVITAAARMVGEVDEGRPAPNAYFASEVALPAYNRMIHALFGHRIGLPMTPMTVTASTTVANGGRYFAGAVAVTLTLPLQPCDGWWFGVSDTNAALATYPVTLARNGWLLEGAAANLTLNTNGTAKEWFFRADVGNWQRVVDLALDDAVWFPDDIVRGLPAMLAMEVAANGYVVAVPDVVAAQANAAHEKISQRYAPRLRSNTDPGIRSIDGFHVGYDITRDR